MLLNDMKKVLKFGLYFFFVGLIYLVGLICFNFIVTQLILSLRVFVDNYLIVFIQLLLFSVFPLILGIWIKNKTRAKILSKILLGLSCAVPFIFFSNSLYFLTHPFQCNPTEKSLGYIFSHLTITSSALLMVIAAVSQLNINDKSYIVWSFLLVYILDLLFVQGWYLFFLGQN